MILSTETTHCQVRRGRLAKGLSTVQVQEAVDSQEGKWGETCRLSLIQAPRLSNTEAACATSRSHLSHMGCSH